MNKEFWTMIGTLVVGGLTYSIISFSYMHSTFTTRIEVEQQDHRIDRMESRVENRLKRIENKIDRIIERGR